MTAASVFTVLAGVVAIIAVAVYFFGIPPEMKRSMEKKALQTMGENKLSYMAKGMPTPQCYIPPANVRLPDQINKIPASDQENVKQLKQGLGNTLGGVVNNPIGEAGGETADRLTSPLTGR